MTQQTKAINLTKFEAGDRPTDQDFIDLFDSILFLNESNGISSNETTLLGDLTIGGNLSILGGGNILISGSFSAGDPTAALKGRINAFTDASTNLPGFYASSSANTVLFQGTSEGTSASIMLSSENDESSFVKFGIENGKGFLDAQGTTVISYSTGSSATAGGDNIVNLSASVGIGTDSPTHNLHIKSIADAAIFLEADTDNANESHNAFIKMVQDGNQLKSSLGLVGNAGKDPEADAATDTLVNSLFLGTTTSHPIQLATDSVARMTIENNGNVGIGTNNPGSLFHVKGMSLLERSTFPQLKFKNDNTTAEMGFGSTTDHFFFKRNDDLLSFRFRRSDGSDVVTFDMAGKKVGINKTDPADELHVIGNSRFEADDANDNYIRLNSQTATQMNQHFYVGNNATWNVYSDDEDYHIRRASANPGTEAGGVSQNYVKFRGGNATTALDKGVEFFVPVTASAFQGDGSGLTNIVGSQISGFVSNPDNNRIVTIVDSTGNAIQGETNFVFTDAGLLGVGTASPSTTVNIHSGSVLIEGPDYVQLAIDQTDSGKATLGVSSGTSEVFLSSTTNDASFDADIKFLTNDGSTQKEVVRFKESGKVGIATDDPKGLLHILNGGTTMGASTNIATSRTNASFVVQDFTNGLSPEFHLDSNEFTVFSSSLFIGALSDATSEADIVFRNGNGSDPTLNTRMVIEGETGNVGIGTNDPGRKLSVVGDIAVRNTANNANVILFSNANSIATEPDILFNASGLIAAEDAVHININTNGGTGDDFFINTGDDDTTNATEVFRVTHDGRIGLGGVNPSNDGLHIYKDESTSSVTGNDNTGHIFLEQNGSGDAAITFLDTGVMRYKIGIDTSNSAALIIRNTTHSTSYFTMKRFSTGTLNRIGYLDSSPEHAHDFSGNVRMQHRLIIDDGLQFTATGGASSGNSSSYITFPLLDDTANTPKFRTALRFPTTDDRALLQYGIESDDDFELRLRLQDGNADKFVIISDSTNDYRALDINGNRAIFFSDNVNGRVGIGTEPANVGAGSNVPKLHVKQDQHALISTFEGGQASGATNTASIINIIRPSGEFGQVGITLERNADLNLGFVGMTGIGTGATGTIDDKQTVKLVAGGATSTKGVLVGSSGRVLIGTGTNHTEGTDQIGNESYSVFGTTIESGLNVGIGNRTQHGFGTYSAHQNVALGRIYFNPQGINANSNDPSNYSSDRFSWFIGQLSNKGASRLCFQASRNATSQNIAFIDSGELGELNFTGQHPCKPQKPITNYVNKIGYIVVSTGVISNEPRNTDDSFPHHTATIDESLPIVDLSNQPNDKRVYGVISQVDNPNTTSRIRQSFAGGFSKEILKRHDDRLVINAVGEGAVMVCNINGNLENGDYITTSAIEGIGMKQDDDLLHNYTVAKIIEDCDFSSHTIDVSYKGVTYKVKLVGCTYHCG